MENFFIRSVVHTPMHGKFLWSNGYVVQDKCIYRGDTMLHALSFSPTHFQVFERGFLLLEHTNIFVLDKLNGEEFIGTLESQPLLVNFNAEESLLLVALKGKCLLLNSYFELVGTLLTPSDVCSVEWNSHAYLIYCATEHSLLILNNQLELLKEIHYGGPITLRSANVLAVACNGRVHFVERNGLEFGRPLVLSEPSGNTVSRERSTNVVSHMRFLDRNTLITVGDYLTLYSSRNGKWYKKLQQETQGSFLGIVRNTLYFECKGIVSIKIFKEFTKSAGMFFVVDGNSLFFYNYWKTIVPPPFYERAFELPGSIGDISLCRDRIAILVYLYNVVSSCKSQGLHCKETQFNSKKDACSKSTGRIASLNVYNIEGFALKYSIDVSSFHENILEIMLLEKVIWIRFETYICSVGVSTGEISVSVKVSDVLKMYFFGRIVLLDTRRRLCSLDENHGIHRILNLKHSCPEKDNEILYYDMQVCKEIYFVQINSQLFCGNLLIDGVVSFLVHRDILIVTKHDSVQYTSLENIVHRREPAKYEPSCLEAYALGDSPYQDGCSSPGETQSPRRIAIRSESLIAERNSVILAYTYLLILYIPRGNIEAFSLRPVIVESVKEHIQNGKYKEALSTCIVNCIQFDIWIGMEIDISKVAASVARSHVIMLFTELLSLLKLGSLDASRILQFLAMRDVMVMIEKVELNREHSDQSPTRCQDTGHKEACVTTLYWNTDPLHLLGCMLHALDNAVLVEILVRIGVFPAALAVADSFEDAVRAAVCHTTPDNLIKQSLLLHNMDMSCRIALILDKRDYLHEIQQMKGEDEKFKVFDYLGMHECALDYLFEKHVSGKRQSSTEGCSLAQAPGTQHMDKTGGRISKEEGSTLALAYVDNHNLYEYSMKYDHPIFIEAYAEKLHRCRNYEKSFDLYKKINLKKALDVSFFMESKYSIDVASQLNMLDTEFYRRLVKSLVQRGHWEEAARLQRDILRENAMSYFLCSGNMPESLLEFAKHAKTHMESAQCTCPGKDVTIDPDQQARCVSVSDILGAYGYVLFDSTCIKKDPHYREFATKLKEMELRESEALDRKACQVDKCVQKIRSICGESCGESDATFSYTLSGMSVKMSEEEFIRKRLSMLKKTVSDLKTNEVVDILERMGITTNLKTKYNNVMKNIQDAADMATLLV